LVLVLVSVIKKVVSTITALLKMRCVLDALHQLKLIKEGV